ncbi:MAG: phosphatidate cytidylyltransferase [Phycisphaerales bacterium JB047]
MLKYRLTFGPLFIVLVGLLAWFDAWLDRQPAPGFLPRETFPPGVGVFLVLAVLGAGGAREVARILTAKGIPVGTGVAIGVQMMGLLAIALLPTEARGTMGLAAGMSTAVLSYMIGVLYAVRDRDVKGAIAIGSGVLFIHVYMGLMLGFLLLIRREHSIWLLVWVLASVKSCDIGAFFTGTAIGKHKMIPWLSPGKTWEGLIGGLVTSGLVALAGSWLLQRNGIAAPGLVYSAIMGVFMGGFGQMGDLAASLLKRDAGVKDSGTSLPGFGGVMDLIDSPILVAPLAYWVLAFTQDQGIWTTSGF